MNPGEGNKYEDKKTTNGPKNCFSVEHLWKFVQEKERCSGSYCQAVGFLENMFTLRLWIREENERNSRIR